MFNKLGFKENIPILLILMIICTILSFLPNPYYKTGEKAIRCKGKIMDADNSDILQYGMVKKGTQTVVLQLISGKFKGRTLKAGNQLMGQMDRDKLFKKGDTALVVLSLDENGNIVFVNPQAHYRINSLIFLFAIFTAGLILFGGWTGARSFFSFIISALIIWKLLIPAFLNGYPPVSTAFAVIILLCSIIIFLVAGVNTKGFAAFAGAILGVLTSCFLSLYFTPELNLHGAIMPFAETLLYSGYGHLDMTGVFIAGIFICASGAVMDLAMDVAASMDELIKKKPTLGRKDLFFSGLRISRTVVGTMTTTLLFAYSGGYVTLLMAFMAQGVPVLSMFNLIYVAAEIMKTLIGSIGLVMVGPFTALVGSFVLTPSAVRKRINASQ